MSFAADVKNELCKAEHSRKQLELLSKGAAFAMTEDGDGCFLIRKTRKPRTASQMRSGLSVSDMTQARALSEERLCIR